MILTNKTLLFFGCTHPLSNLNTHSYLQPPHTYITYVPSSEKLNFTHAYFPYNAFDEAVQKGNWTFGRKGDGYIALYSQNATEWKTNAKGEKDDLVAAGKQNIWLCEMGDKKQWGNFSKFIKCNNSF